MNSKILILPLLLLIPSAGFAAKKKKSKLDPVETYAKAVKAYEDYDPATAMELCESLLSLSNLTNEAEVEALQARAERMQTMMQRVDAIEVIDSLNVSRADFFAGFRLSPAAGRVFSPEELDGGFNAADSTAVYMSENGSVMLWSTDRGLMSGHRLTDGSWEPGEPLGDNLNAGGTARNPFLMPDGVTLYYAADGEDSLGGLDLYVSRRNGDSFPAPQNMGLPYNSPFDDLMLAIDEETGAGWWATDRNSPGGNVTIYMFVPSDTRVNVDVNDPDLAGRARLSSIAATQGDEDRSALLQRVKAIVPFSSSDNQELDFSFALPSGRILTSWDDFKSARARRLMENYVDAVAENEADKEKLAQLRLRYGRGDQKCAAQIRQLEKKVRAAEVSLLKMSNMIIEEEK